MNENVPNMMILCTILALFLSACFLTLGMTGQINLALHEAASTAAGQARSVQTVLTESSPDTFGGAQAFMIAVDHAKTGIRINIDGIEIREEDPAKLAKLALFETGAKYRAIYFRDNAGKLTGVQFQKLMPGEELP
ncbi:hypothetical protein [Paenibacillus azoreducens]|uniref:Uncharacterized protein n=1 Tax=Paenibacillus azoreducens TaxID=116718 RepID=A0A920CPI4_9BACL|nr:hypothetical protein [Paenibacillus azoreducens]GIO46360.1 hypothetical protein J34TS1_11250 [Paenibacillus azoreducens]